jgi:hypothetical protein
MDVLDLEELRKQYPFVSFIFNFHTTKEGHFKGVNTHAHEVYVIIEVGKGEAKANGRFNARGSIFWGKFESKFDVKKIHSIYNLQ